MDAQENPSLEGNELEEKVFETEASSTDGTEQPAVVLPTNTRGSYRQTQRTCTI